METRSLTSLIPLIAVAIVAGMAGAFLFSKTVETPAPAQSTEQAGVSAEQVGALVREYILANPDIVEEAQQVLQAKQEEESRQLSVATIVENKDAIFNNANDIVLGNPQGDVTVVEFFDYNCGYCKRALTDMTSLLEKDSNIRFVLKEFPILGPDSMAAHQVAMSLRKIAPEKYIDFHILLMGGEARATEALAIDIAKGLGVDEAALISGMEDPAIGESIRETYELANALGISGTPSFVVGDETVFGAVGEQALMAKITNMRECESTRC